MKMFAVRLCATLAVASLSAGSADAARYLVSYSSLFGTFSGTIVTGDTADAAGFYAITGLTNATHNGAAATLQPAGSLFSDNLFKPTSTYFTGSGVSYAAGGDWYNIFYADGAVRECVGAPGDDSCFVTGTRNFTVTAVAGGVPEPATWATMIAGFALLGAALRRRRAAALA